MVAQAREFLVSEAMHALRVPTTRALALVASRSERVERQWYDNARSRCRARMSVTEANRTVGVSARRVRAASPHPASCPFCLISYLNRPSIHPGSHCLPCVVEIALRQRHGSGEISGPSPYHSAQPDRTCRRDAPCCTARPSRRSRAASRRRSSALGSSSSSAAAGRWVRSRVVEQPSRPTPRVA